MNEEIIIIIIITIIIIIIITIRSLKETRARVCSGKVKRGKQEDRKRGRRF